MSPKNENIEISNDTLKQLADQKKEEVVNAPVVDTEEILDKAEENPDLSSLVKPQEETIHVGKKGGKKGAVTQTAVGNNETYKGITPDEMKDMMPNLADNEESFDNTTKEILAEIEKFRKNLIVEHGMTPEEADTAAKNRLKNKATQANNDYLRENPTLGIIEIKKEDREDLALTPEEHSKLTTVKEIQLVLKETKELAALPVKKTPSNFKSKFIRDIEGSIARYSLPLPVMGDFITFRGAQTIQLVSAVENEDDTIVDMIRKRSSLIYDRMIGGTVFTKYKDDGSLLMSYEDFVNNFKFHDMDMALFGILCASTAEEMETEFGCGKCGKSFNYKYNMKAVLDTKSITGIFKDALDEIEKNKYNTEAMKQMIEDSNTVMRFQSDYTKNVYDIAFPSIAKVEKIMEMINNQDTTELYFATLAVFIEDLYIYDTKDGEYFHIKGSDTAEGKSDLEELLRILPELPEKDTAILNAEIQKKIFVPKFIMNSTCPECGNVMTNEFSINELVFQRAQDMSGRILA